MAEQTFTIKRKPDWGTPAMERAIQTRYSVNPESGCFEWTGHKNKGYGIIARRRKHLRAHRVAYEYAKAEIPPGLVIDHLCRNPACINPDHLEAVTPRENTYRGVSSPAMNRRKEACKRGHPLSGDNLFFDGPERQCLTCHRARSRASMRRIRMKAREASQCL